MMCFIEKQLEQANAYCFFEKPRVPKVILLGSRRAESRQQAEPAGLKKDAGS